MTRDPDAALSSAKVILRLSKLLRYEVDRWHICRSNMRSDLACRLVALSVL